MLKPNMPPTAEKLEDSHERVQHLRPIDFELANFDEYTHIWRCKDSI